MDALKRSLAAEEAKPSTTKDLKPKKPNKPAAGQNGAVGVESGVSHPWEVKS
jgi:hypothetical protein